MELQGRNARTHYTPGLTHHGPTGSVLVPCVVARSGLLDLGIHLVPIAADREAERARDATEVAQPA